MRPFIRTQITELSASEVDLPDGNMKVGMTQLASAGSGGFTAIVDFPAGFERSAAGYYDVEEFFVVLSGALEWGDKEIGEYQSFLLPAGVTRPTLASTVGCRALAVFRGSPRWERVRRAPDSSDNGRYMCDARNATWAAMRLNDFPPGAARKELWRQGDEVISILGLLPFWSSPYVESHSFEEEIVLASGSLELEGEVIRAPYYFCHPPDTRHGPMRTSEGAMMIVITRGPFGNTYEPLAAEYSWT